MTDQRRRRTDRREVSLPIIKYRWIKISRYRTVQAFLYLCMLGGKVLLYLCLLSGKVLMKLCLLGGKVLLNLCLLGGKVLLYLCLLGSKVLHLFVRV